MSRMMRDVSLPNLGVGLDTANLILYGKANPVDAVDILGPHVRSVHAKDGKWPTDPSKLGEEVMIGKGWWISRRYLRSCTSSATRARSRLSAKLRSAADRRREEREGYLERILAEVLG